MDKVEDSSEKVREDEPDVVAEETVLLVPFDVQFSSTDGRGKFIFADSEKSPIVIQEVEWGPVHSAEDLSHEIDQMISHLAVTTNGKRVMLLCRNNSSIRGVLFGLAQAHGLALEEYSLLREFYTWGQWNTFHEMAYNVHRVKYTDLKKEQITSEYDPTPQLSMIAQVTNESVCTVALKLNSCKDQSLDVIWAWFNGLDPIPGGICPLINKFGSGSRSQDVLVHFATEELAQLATERWATKWGAQHPQFSNAASDEFRNATLTCSVLRSALFKSIFEDVHPTCKKLIQRMCAPDSGKAIVRLKGLTFQTTPNQLLGILKREMPDLSIENNEVESSVVFPLRGVQQSLKTGDAFVLCRDTNQALQIKQRFTHFHHAQRTWEVYLSSVGEMVQVFRAHAKGEFISRNKRANPFTTLSEAPHFTPLFTTPLPLLKPSETSGEANRRHSQAPLFVSADEAIGGVQQQNSLLGTSSKAKLPLMSSVVPFAHPPTSIPPLQNQLPMIYGMDPGTAAILPSTVAGGTLSNWMFNMLATPMMPPPPPPLSATGSNPSCTSNHMSSLNLGSLQFLPMSGLFPATGGMGLPLLPSFPDPAAGVMSSGQIFATNPFLFSSPLLSNSMGIPQQPPTASVNGNLSVGANALPYQVKQTFSSFSTATASTSTGLPCQFMMPNVAVPTGAILPSSLLFSDPLNLSDTTGTNSTGRAQQQQQQSSVTSSTAASTAVCYFTG